MEAMMKLELEPDADEDVAWYKFNGTGRLILNTLHGEIIIDIRTKDVNAFTFKDGKRKNSLLIEN